MTPRQKQAFDFIAGYQVRTTGVSPSMQEIADHLGVSSRGNAYRLVAALQERGHLRMRYGRSRSIELRPVTPRITVRIGHREITEPMRFIPVRQQ